MELERKFMQFGTGISVTDGSEISGYASLFGKPDQGGDIVSQGAYESCLSRLATEGRQVKMLWQHDPARPIGVWDEVREDAKGLWVKGRILGDVAQGSEAIALIAAGAIDGLSIGYRTKQAAKTPQGRQLQEVDLWEVSLVTFPMLAEARVAAKADESAQELQVLAAAFRDLRQAIQA